MSVAVALCECFARDGLQHEPDFLPTATKLLAAKGRSRLIGAVAVAFGCPFEGGVRYFDSTMGRVGGHAAKVKYGGGHTGNVCAEDLISLFESMGVSTGINLDGFGATAEHCESVLGRELHGRTGKSGLNPLISR